MEQLTNWADERLLHGCVYCGGPEETRDHVPSRILLDPPFPENLPVVPACFSCNNSLAPDEEYLASAIECAYAGSVDPTRLLRRPRVAKILEHSPALRARLEAAATIIDGQFAITTEDARVEKVLRKLALGHAAFDLSQPLRAHAASIIWWPLSIMTQTQRANFDAPHAVQLFGEIGSRAFQRMLTAHTRTPASRDETSPLGVFHDWVEVQESRYRYLAIDDLDGPSVRIVIGDFLAAEIRWAEEELSSHGDSG